MTARDTATLSSMLMDDLTYTHSNRRTENKQEHLKNIASGNIVYLKILPESSHIRVRGKTSLITGVVSVEGIYQGQNFNLRLAYTDVYFKDKGRWKLAAWQSVRLN